MLIPYLAEPWRAPYAPGLYSFLGNNKCFKLGMSGNIRLRLTSHRRRLGQPAPHLRVWLAHNYERRAQLEQEALAIARAHSPVLVYPNAEDFPMPRDLKKLLDELDEWAAAAGLRNIVPELKWRRVKPAIADAA